MTVTNVFYLGTVPEVRPRTVALYVAFNGRAVPYTGLAPFPWYAPDLESTFCPGKKRRLQIPLGEHVDGHAALHYCRCKETGETWTALGFWDHSVSKHDVSHSALIVQGRKTFPEMTKLFSEKLPLIWRRFHFPITLIETVDERQYEDGQFSVRAFQASCA